MPAWNRGNTLELPCDRSPSQELLFYPASILTGHDSLKLYGPGPYLNLFSTYHGVHPGTHQA